MPVIPVPLLAPDADLSLDLMLAFSTIYERAAYDLSLDYSDSPPPPTLTPSEQSWLKQQLESR